jgi:hypothetical protein
VSYISCYREESEDDSIIKKYNLPKMIVVYLDDEGNVKHIWPIDIVKTTKAERLKPRPWENDTEYNI